MTQARSAQRALDVRRHRAGVGVEARLPTGEDLAEQENWAISTALRWLRDKETLAVLGELTEYSLPLVRATPRGRSVSVGAAEPSAFSGAAPTRSSDA